MNTDQQIHEDKVQAIVDKIQLYGDRVLVKEDPLQETTDGGIFIPQTVKERPRRGTVMLVGPGLPDDPMTVQVGTKVLYGKYAGTDLNISREKFLLMRDDDVYARIPTDEAEEINKI